MDTVLGLILLALSLLPIFFSAACLVELAPVSGKCARTVQVILIGCAQIILFSLLLGIFDALYWQALFSVSVIFAAGCFFFTRTRSKLPDYPSAAPVISFIRVGIRTYPVSTIAALLIVSLFVLNALWAIWLGPLFGDAEAYHLSRAYFWNSSHSLDYFQTQDARQVESPVNANLLQFWLMAFGENYALTHLPQVLGAALIVLASIEIARTFRAPGHIGFFVGCLILCAPQIALGATNGSNDLLSGGFGIAGLMFGLRAIRLMTMRGIAGRTWPYEAAMCGLAAGLAMGGKVTAILLFFGIAVSLLAVALVRRVPIKRLAMFAILAGGVTVAFGSYSYVRNIVEFGHPVYSAQAVAEHGEIFRNDNRDPIKNTAVTLLQTPDLHGFAVGPLKPARQIERKAVAGALDVVGAEEAVSDRVLGYYDRATERADWNGSGYGILGFAIMMFSPIIIGLAFWRLKPATALIYSSPILAGWIYVFLVSAIVPWNVTGAIRYLQAGFPFIALGSVLIVARLVSWRWVSPVLVLSIAPLLYVTLSGGEGARAHGDARFAKPFQGPLHYLYGGRQSGNIDLFTDNFSNGRPVAISTRKHTYQFYFIREMQGVDFVPAGPDEIIEGLQDGSYAAAVVSPLDDYAGLDQFLMPTVFDRRRQFWLLVPDARQFLRDNVSLYNVERDGARIILPPAAMTNFLGERQSDRARDVGLLGPQWSAAQLLLALPTGLSEGPDALSFAEISLSDPVPDGGEVTARCGDVSVPTRIRQNRQTIRLLIGEAGCVTPEAAMTQLVVEKSVSDRLYLEEIVVR